MQDYGIIEALDADYAMQKVARAHAGDSERDFMWFKSCLTATEVSSVAIKEVHYGEARLISTAQFENARVEIGCTVSIEGSTPEDADKGLAEAKEFVRSALVDRITEIMDKSRRECDDEKREVVAKKYGLSAAKVSAYKAARNI